MKRILRRILPLALILSLASAVVSGAPIPLITGPADVTVMQSIVNNLINQINNLNAAATAQSGAQGILSFINSASNISHLRAGLAHVATNSGNSLLGFIGDSTVFGVTGVAAGQNWPQQFSNGLMKKGIRSQTCAWMGDGTASARRTTDARVVAGSSWTTYDDTDTTVGGGVWSATTNTNALAMTCEYETNTAVVFYEINSLGTCTIDADGNSPHTLDESGAAAVGSFTYSTGTAYHTFNFKEASGTCKILGLYTYDSNKSWAIVFNAGTSGSTSNGITGTTNPWSPTTMLASLAFDALWVEGGINDPFLGVSQATFQTNIQNLINEQKTTVGRDIILQTADPSNPADGTHNTTLATQAAYAGILTALGTNNNVPYVDIYNRWQSYTVSSGLECNYYTDTYVHPSACGYRDIAAANTAFVFGQQETATGDTSTPATTFVAWGPAGYMIDGVNAISFPKNDTTFGQSTAVGSGALVGQTGAAAGYANTAVGYHSMNNATLTGTLNTAIGALSLTALTSGIDNVAVGDQALAGVTTGGHNAGFGFGAGLGVTTASDVTAFGYRAGRFATGANSVFVGSGAGAGTTGITGANNTVIGFSVGSVTLTTGTNNILIGTNGGVDTLTAGTSNTVDIGNVLYATGIGTSAATPAGQVGIGTATPIGTAAISVNGSINQSFLKSCTTGVQTDAAGTMSACVASDATLKEAVSDLSYDPSVLDKLRPVSYSWIDKETRDGKEHIGFLAQDVQKAVPKAVVSAGNDKLGIDSNAMIAVITLELQHQKRLLRLFAYAILGLAILVGFAFVAGRRKSNEEGF